MSNTETNPVVNAGSEAAEWNAAEPLTPPAAESTPAEAPVAETPSVAAPAEPATEPEESFADALSLFERSHAPNPNAGNKQISGTVISVSADSVFVDIGFKVEGILPLAIFTAAGETPAPGDKVSVSVKGRNEEGYYELSRKRVEQPKDWDSMERAFAEKTAIVGTVTAVVKGGLTVDVGMRAFMPASRSGARDAAEMEKLVGQEIRCRITKLDVAAEDLVVDRRVVNEEDERSSKDERFSQVSAGDIVQGTIRTLTDYGAFVDLGGVDGLLHVGEIAWARVAKPEDALTVGQKIEVKVLKIEPESRRISLSMKQLLPHPWESIADKYKAGDRVHGTVTRLADFGAFLELEPGIEGMIHVSEMSWVKRVKKPADLLKVGDVAEVVILSISAGEHRMALGLKQALGDPWTTAVQQFPVNSNVEGEVTRFATFGAFVQVSEGIEGLVHISEITSEKRLTTPQEALRLGQKVQARVLEVDKDKRQLRLSIKQTAPTGLEEFLAEHNQGDRVSGRIVEVKGQETASVELGDGVYATSKLLATPTQEEKPAETKVDLSSLTSMLSARWKGTSSAGAGKASSSGNEAVRAGQLRNFEITKLDLASKVIELQLL